MNILVTGMSGVGKSTLCAHLRGLGYRAFDLDEIPGMCKLYHADGSEVADNEDRVHLNMLETDYLCDAQSLADHLKVQIETSFYGGYADNFAEIAELFDRVVLLTTTPEENKRRMSLRTTTDFAKDTKTQDELMAHKNEWESLVRKYDPLVIDATAETADIATILLDSLDLPIATELP